MGRPGNGAELNLMHGVVSLNARIKRDLQQAMHLMPFHLSIEFKLLCIRHQANALFDL